MLHSKQPPIVRKFSGDGPFGYDSDLPPAPFCERTEGVDCASCWMPFVSARARMTHQPQVHGQQYITETIKLKKRAYRQNFKKNLQWVDEATGKE